MYNVRAGDFLALMYYSVGYGSTDGETAKSSRSHISRNCTIAPAQRPVNS